MMKKILLPFLSLFSIPLVSAHCPLCTIGAGAAAAGAVYFGVTKAAISVLLGGFAVSMGYWISKSIKKKYIPYQDSLIILASFILTILPILPIISQTKGIYIPIGQYGKTYAINLSFYTSIIGGIIVISTPYLSKKITSLRRKTIPFQGVALTILLLIITGGIVQIAL